MSTSTRILGVGTGVFIIALTWSLALIFSVLFYRVRGLLAVGLTAAAGIITAILFAIPFDEENNQNNPAFTQGSIAQITDIFFLPRIVILILEIFGALAGCGLLFHQLYMQPRSTVNFRPKSLLN